ncbi:preprotein translocase subunit SecA [Phycisphaeraceae bacterium D3-23]
MVAKKVKKAFTKVFGSHNDRMIKRYRQRVDEINALEPQTRKLTDAALSAKTAEFRERIEQGEAAKPMLPEVLATAREAMDRFVGIRNIFNDEFSFDPSKLPADLQGVYAEIKQQADALEPKEVLGGEPAPGYLQVEVPNALYEAVREIYPESRPPFRARPFDVQLIGGMVLGEGRIAEMRTGEGKTIVAPLACYVACCEGLSCHVVTVNDYLVQRDRDWVFPFYFGLGLTVGAIHPHHMQPPPLKKKAYECDVLYATNSELGFDYLRDNMKMTVEEQVQKKRDFVIVDEVDSILIDEARTPLIISGPKHAEPPPYDMADDVARHLIEMQKPWQQVEDKVRACEKKMKGLEGDIRNSRDKAAVPAMKQTLKDVEQEMFKLEDERDQHVQYYEVEMEKKAAHLTHEGIETAQNRAGIGSFYVGDNMDIPHLLENALRGHVIYKKDKDYVVHNGEIVIVDINTGRMMIGRQWSDGLHQAIECKERVEIKKETQTLATVTIQNFFKLYKRLAGMTGTAITEATEFHEIYGLDVVAIPTNKPIAREDREDLIFLSEKDKWSGILDEIKRMHDVGRPVLVGTTSVENSELISQMLKRKYNIKHSVLNAKAEHAEREGNIVEDAGQLGAVMIATNMAGRGTDIKLRAIERAALVKHWQSRHILPSQAKPEHSDEELIEAAYRYMAERQLGMKRKETLDASGEDMRLRLCQHWLIESGEVSEKKAEGMSLDECVEAVGALSDYDHLRLGIYRLHDLKVWENAEHMGGLHIIGTERHESRRIDNQLRGRAGRQGDQGASRFFLALEDPLMKMFAGERTLAILSKLGMKEGDAIEHGMVSRSVERAQRKVEQRNYEVRKNLLEYDEIMEHQRGFFYGDRQNVLEGKGIEAMIFDHIGDAVGDAVDKYLDKNYTREQCAEWARQQLEVTIDPARLYLDDHREMEKTIRSAGLDEVVSIVDVTLGEYISTERDAAHWDIAGLVGWAKTKFDVEIDPAQAKAMSVPDLRRAIIDGAQDKVEVLDLSGVVKFMDTLYGEKEFAHWAELKFEVKIDPEKVAALKEEKKFEEIVDLVLREARELYKVREVEYPIEFAMAIFSQGMQQDQAWALNQLYTWGNGRFDLGWTPDQFAQELNGKNVADWLREQTKAWTEPGGKLEAQAKEKAAELRSDDEALVGWIKERFSRDVSDEELDTIQDREELILKKGKEMFRAELTRLERYVLLQILDQAWKDHLYAMDMLRGSINWAALAEKDPRTEYKREGSKLFGEMQATVRDRVTELAFKARLTPNVQLKSKFGGQMTTRHPAPASANTAPPAPAGSPQPGGQPEPVGAGAPAQQTTTNRGGDDNRPVSRKQRRASAARKRRADR